MNLNKDQLKNISDLVSEDNQESVSSDEVQEAPKSASARKDSSQKPLSQKQKKVAGIRLIDKFNNDEISNPDSVIENDKIKNEIEIQKNKDRIEIEVPQQKAKDEDNNVVGMGLHYKKNQQKLLEFRNK